MLWSSMHKKGLFSIQNIKKNSYRRAILAYCAIDWLWLPFNYGGWFFAMVPFLCCCDKKVLMHQTERQQMYFVDLTTFHLLVCTCTNLTHTSMPNVYCQWWQGDGHSDLYREISSMIISFLHIHRCLSL